MTRTVAQPDRATLAVFCLTLAFTIWPTSGALADTCGAELAAAIERAERIPAAAISPSPGKPGIHALGQRVETEGGRLLDGLDTLEPFSGLYLRGEHERRLGDGQGGSNLALEWEAFSDGRDEAVKRLDKSRLEHRVQYYQLLRDMRERALQERRLGLQQSRNKVFAEVYKLEAATLEGLLHRRKQELKAGTATRGDLAELAFKLKRANLQTEYLAGARQAPVDPAEAALLERAATLRTKPFVELLKQATENSFEYKLQTLFATRGDYFPAWTDDVSLRVYLERRQGFEQQADGVLGVRLRIPLEREGKRDELVALEKSLYRDQGEAVVLRLAQKLESLLDNLRLKQSALKVSAGELALMAERRELACIMVANPVSSIEATPDRELVDLSIQAQEKIRDMHGLRFDILDLLVELEALVWPTHPEDLLRPDEKAPGA